MSKLIAIREIARTLDASFKRIRTIVSNLDLPTETMYSGKAGPPALAVSHSHLEKILEEYGRTSIEDEPHIPHNIAVEALEIITANTGMSIYKIASEIGVDKSLLYHVRAGDKPMTLNTYRKLTTWQKEREDDGDN